MAHPIVDALLNHVRSSVYPMHVPGHKQGRGSDTIAAAVIPQYFYKIDLTEIPGLDDLYEPTGCIREAQAEAASLFGADRTFFLVNGSTVGIEAAILATCGPGSKIAVSGVVHQSVVAGIALAGSELVRMETMVSSRFLMPLGVDAAEVERCLACEDGIAAVLVTNPSYYGVCQDLRAIADACHNHGAIFIVDEAHGAHLKFSEELPPSALDSGADIVVQSGHKTLGAVTQTALLHIKGTRVEPERVAASIRMLQTSSPSYVLMASLDSVLHRLSIEGEELVARAVSSARFARDALNRLPIDVLSPEDLDPVFSLDATRLTLSAANLGILGPELENRLRARGYQMEFSDLLSSIAVITYADSVSDLEGFCRAVEDALGNSAPDSSVSRLRKRIYPKLTEALAKKPEFALTVRDAVFSDKTFVDLEASVGRIAGECVSPYPPGIPLLYPGQVITRDDVDLVGEFLDLGIRFHGIAMEGGKYLCSVVDD